MHEPEKWGFVYFSSKSVGSSVSFSVSQDDKIKLKLYELYRSQKKYYIANNTWATSIKSISPSEIIVDEKTLKPTIENYSLGWIISIKSPFSNKVLSVREDGKFFLKE